MPDPDLTKPNHGYPYSTTSMTHDFKYASSGAKDGIRLSRWHRKRNTPFGGEFDYTDPNDLTGRFLRPGDRWSRWGRLKMAYRAFIGRHSKQPVGWIMIDSDEAPVAQAHMMTSVQGEVKISAIEVRSCFPIWPENYSKAMITMDGYESLQEGQAMAKHWAAVNAKGKADDDV